MDNEGYFEGKEDVERVEEYVKIRDWLVKNDLVKEIGKEWIKNDEKYIEKYGIDKLNKGGKELDELLEIRWKFLDVLIEDGYKMKIDESKYKLMDLINEYLVENIEGLKIK